MFAKLTAALALCCATLTGCGGRSAPPAPERARTVMSFNIRYGTANDGHDAWPNRRAQVLDVLRRDSAELIGIQEALLFQLDEIRAALPGFTLIGVGRDDGRLAGEYAALLVRADRYVVEDSGTFWFSDTPSVPGSRHWGNNITRICTWALLRQRADGRRLWVYNVHLDHESQPSRERSVALLLERIAARAPAGPVLVFGDFNAGESNPAVQRMAAPFRDSYRVAHRAETVVGTFNAFRGDSTGEKIDYIFVSPEWRVLDAAIDRTRVSGRFPSDHFAVTARLELP